MATAYIVLPFVVFVINVFLAALVMRSDWRSFRNRVFTAFLIAMALWGLTIFGMRSSPNLQVAFQWERVVLMVIPFSGITFYHFTMVFTGTRRYGLTVRAFYALGVLTGALSLAGLSAPEMQEKFYGYAPVLGPAFPLVMLAAYTPAVLGLLVLTRSYRKSRAPDERNRLLYISLGVVALLFGATMDYLPALGLTLYPMGIVSLILFGVLATVAVVRYRLMDLRLVLRRGFAYSVLSSGVFAVYGLMFWLFLTIFQYQRTTASIVATVAAILLVTMVLPPTVGRAQRFVDRLFSRERYDHLAALQQFTQETRDIGDFPGLASSLLRTTIFAMQSAWATLLLPDPESGHFVPVGGDDGETQGGLWVRRTSPLARWLARHQAALTARDLEQDPYLQALEDAERIRLYDAGARLFVGLVSNKQLTGILVLGPRLTEEDYSHDAIDLLTTVTAQTATMVENSRLYSQEMSRLRELERLEHLKSSLLRTVSHELKSPVTAIRASVDLFTEMREGLGEEGVARVTRTLRSGVDRLDRLVQESLDYAQMQTAQLELRLERTDLMGVVSAVVGLISPSTTAKQQHLQVEVPDGLPRLLIDGPRVERVLVNLLSNASKFTRVGGEISLSVRWEETRVVIEVADNGLGIPEEDHRHLFTEFYRGSNPDMQRSAGTGLGLAIAKYLAELHGGTISVSSTLGEGTTFTLVLPHIPAPEEETPPEAP